MLKRNRADVSHKSQTFSYHLKFIEIQHRGFTVFVKGCEMKTVK